MFDKEAVRELTDRFALRQLFVESLGWDRSRGAFYVQTRKEPFELSAIAEKRGYQVFVVSPGADGRIPLAGVRSELSNKVAAVSREHFLIFVDAPRRQMLWTPPLGYRGVSAHRCFVPGVTEGLLNVLRGLVFAFAEEDRLTLGMVRERVRAAFRDDRRAYVTAHYQALRHAELEAGIKETPDGRSEFYSMEFQKYAEEYGRFPLLTGQEEKALARTIASRVEPEATQAWERLVASNLRLVVDIAKRYRNAGLDLLDLVQHGNIGLMRAASRFDPERDTKFSTYATWWIRQGITRGIADEGRTIRVPVHAHETLRNVRQEQIQFEEEHGRAPTLRELEDLLAMVMGHRKSELSALSGQLLEDFLLSTQAAVSLERLVARHDRWEGDADSDQVEVGPDWPDADQEKPHQIAVHSALGTTLEAALETLSSREQRILKLRFGLIDGESRTLEEIGEQFGLTRERIRQLEAKALKKLRHPSRKRLVADFLPLEERRVAVAREQPHLGWNHARFGASWWPCLCFTHEPADNEADLQCSRGPSLRALSQWKEMLRQTRLSGADDQNLAAEARPAHTTMEGHARPMKNEAEPQRGVVRPTPPLGAPEVDRMMRMDGAARPRTPIAEQAALPGMLGDRERLSHLERIPRKPYRRGRRR